MKLVINNSALVLDRWQTVELVDAAGTTAVIDNGCVWITMESDRRDIVLGSGQSFTVAKNGRTLVHAEIPTTLRIVDGPVRDTLNQLWKKARVTLDRWAGAIEQWAVREIDRARALPRY